LVCIDRSKAYLGFMVFRGGQRFEREQVERHAIPNEARHVPSEFAQWDYADGVGQLYDCLHGRRADGGPRLAQLAGEGSLYGRISQGPAQTVIPESGRAQPTAVGTDIYWLITQQHPEKEVVVDHHEALAQARSGSAAATSAASLA
jgi:hypothetical protein